MTAPNIAPADDLLRLTVTFGFDTVPPGDAPLAAGGGDGGNSLPPSTPIQLAVPDPGKVAAVPLAPLIAS
jgi:hypothetical protein